MKFFTFLIAFPKFSDDSVPLYVFVYAKLLRARSRAFVSDGIISYGSPVRSVVSVVSVFNDSLAVAICRTVRNDFGVVEEAVTVAQFRSGYFAGESLRSRRLTPSIILPAPNKRPKDHRRGNGASERGVSPSSRRRIRSETRSRGAATEDDAKDICTMERDRYSCVCSRSCVCETEGDAYNSEALSYFSRKHMDNLIDIIRDEELNFHSSRILITYLI